ncbi:hypothetical protein ABFW07_09505 [Acinetobacter soli]|uniref:hypothetical protein n=1 Tax=Acinetobacter soli TaxID=487316 RepID=UPI003218B59D
MKTTITKIALAAAFLSTAAMANAGNSGGSGGASINVTDLLDALAHYSKYTDSTAFNVAVNTGKVDASVDIGSVNNNIYSVAYAQPSIETSAIGAANVGDTYLEQGKIKFDVENGSPSMTNQRGGGGSMGNVDLGYFETLDNYSEANVAYNSGSIDAAVTLKASTYNNIGSIATSAIGAVNAGNISVVVK